ncbi:MAG: DUF1772 domain-containing protein [Pararhizobium sp.]|nr:anthrone oxygenase family protein [Pararhizobium sp.]MDO9414679.1 DUF1772 domain-containing protein [Pararhizobium sp.]
MSALVSPLSFVAALGAGLNAGLFFIFSVCIMGALGRLPPAQGMAAMQSINRVIQNPVFFLVFGGTSLLALVLAIGGFLAGGPARLYLISGGLLFFFGMFVVTVVFNVPMNEALDAAVPGSDIAAGLWADYLVTWVNWNHVRTVSSVAALGLFIMAFKTA